MPRLNDKKIKNRIVDLMLEAASTHRKRKEIEERAEQEWLELSDKIKNGSFTDEDTEEMRRRGEAHLAECRMNDGEKSIVISKMLLLVIGQ